MSSPILKRSQASNPVPDTDHRKRPRNRATKSCLPCFKSKRMCDRKRPCSRCTQLNMTGMCVYEVEPEHPIEQKDEIDRLQNRVADLEAVIRELKNKPHPRWKSPPAASSRRMASRATPPASPRVAGSPAFAPMSPSASPGMRPTVVTGLNGGHPATTSPVNSTFPIPTRPTSRAAQNTQGCYFPPFSLPSPISASSSSGTLTPPEDIDHCFGVVEAGHSHVNPADLDHQFMSMLASSYEGILDIHDDMLGLAPGDMGRNLPMTSLGQSHPAIANVSTEPCLCPSDTDNYHVLLELSLRLRKTAATLSGSQHHCAGTSCPLLHRVMELDFLTSSILGNTPTPTAFASPALAARTVPFGAGQSRAQGFASIPPMQLNRPADQPAIPPEMLNAGDSWAFYRPPGSA